MPFTNYTTNPDGSYTFSDASGQSTPPMAGPAALQQKNKIDMMNGGGVVPPVPSIRGERAELSPEMLEAGAPGDDLRTANFQAPSGSVMDAGGMKAGDVDLIKGMQAQEQARHVNIPSQGTHGGSMPVTDLDKSKYTLQGKSPDQAFTDGGHVKVHMAGSGGSKPALSMPTVVSGGATGGGGRRVEVQTGRSVHEQKNVFGDEDVVANKQAGQAQYNAVDDEALAAEAANNSIAKEKEDAVNKIQDTAQKQLAREQLRQQEAQSRLAELDTLRKDVGARIDPQQYWADKSEGQKIGAALLMGLGVMAGTKEPMNIFNNAVERNIDAQKANITAARGKLDDAKGAMAEYMKLGTSEKEAEHLTRSLLLDDANRRLDLISTQTNNQKIKAAAEARKAEIMKANAQEALKLNETVVGQTKNYAVGTVGGAGAQNVMYDDVKKDQTVRGPDGKIYEFGEGATAQKASERLTEINQNKQDADQLSTIIQNPSYLVDPDKRAAANAIAHRLAIHAGKAEGTNGRINEGYFKAVGEAITNGDVNSITNLGRNAALTEYRSGLDTEGMGIIQQHAVSSVKPFLLVNPKTGAREIKYIRTSDAPKQAPDMRGTQVGE